nr:hypothetical protein [Tanacetum cinerariifolium]
MREVAKTINGEVKLQALVDGKKVIITEPTIRRDLQLEDAEGFDCLSNAAIFEQLTLMGYEKILKNLSFYKAFFSPQWKFLIHTILQCISAKTTVWNDFSSTIASAIICLATNQKFNFSKYIFESMVKNLDNVNKFLMYPRVGKDFSGRVTPLFPTMMVQAQEAMGECSAHSNDPHHTPIIIQPSTSQPQKKQKYRKTERKDTKLPQTSVPTSVADEAVNEEMDDKSIKTTQALEIDSLKRRVKKLERRKRSRTHGLKRVYKVGLSARVESSEDKGLDVVEKAKEVVDDIILAKALMESKSAKPKAIKIVIQEPEHEEDAEEDPEEDPKEDLEEKPEDDDDDIEMDDEAEVIDPYTDDGSNNLPPLNSEDEETPPTSSVIPDADGKMEKFMFERIDTKGRIKKKFKEQDRHFLGLGCDNTEMDRTMRNVMSNLSGLKKLVKGLSDRFDEYERIKVFDAKRVLEKELVNERNGKEFYQEFDEYMCRMLQNRQKSEGSFPLPLSS